MAAGSILRVVTLTLWFSVAAVAQPPRGFFPWWDRPVVKDLNLSPGQIKQIRVTVRGYRDKLIELRAALDKAELGLSDIFEDERVDQKKADLAVENLAHARENLTRAFAQMQVQLRLVLNQDQWRELQKRREAIDAEKKALQKKP